MFIYLYVHNKNKKQKKNTQYIRFSNKTLKNYFFFIINFMLMLLLKRLKDKLLTQRKIKKDKKYF